MTRAEREAAKREAAFRRFDLLVLGLMTRALKGPALRELPAAERQVLQSVQAGLRKRVVIKGGK